MPFLPKICLNLAHLAIEEWCGRIGTNFRSNLSDDFRQELGRIRAGFLHSFGGAVSGIRTQSIAMVFDVFQSSRRTFRLF